MHNFSSAHHAAFLLLGMLAVPLGATAAPPAAPAAAAPSPPGAAASPRSDIFHSFGGHKERSPKPPKPPEGPSPSNPPIDIDTTLGPARLGANPGGVPLAGPSTTASRDVVTSKMSLPATADDLVAIAWLGSLSLLAGIGFQRRARHRR
jgi:hypothetical protein